VSGAAGCRLFNPFRLILKMGSCASCISNVNNSPGNLELEEGELSAKSPVGNISTVYETLPSEYENHFVTKVYDGDTLTLRSKSNGPNSSRQRVRLIGIDAPEIKECQPFAEEAKKFTLDSCENMNIYLSFEPNGDKKDRYGRLVAWIWLKVNGGGYLNVNEALVAKGLASVYFYGPGKLQNRDKMISLQRSARKQKIGKWADFIDGSVLKTPNGQRYHCTRDCTHLQRSNKLISLKASVALDIGLSPCRGCHK